MRPAAGGRAQALSLFFAGILPVIAFTLIEDRYGTVAGLIAGMIFGGGEITWELIRYRHVNKITWIGNGLILVLGAVSLISSEGLWFKLQPALMEALFALVLWASLLMKKNLLVFLAEQQGQSFPEEVKHRMGGLSLRMGFFFALHALLATWAALRWSTNAWALLKGLGFTGSFILYMFAETLWLRKKIRADREQLLASQSEIAGSSEPTPPSSTHPL